MSEKDYCKRNGKDGSTTSAYVVAETIYDIKGMTANIKNTHATSSMYYKITGYMSPHASCVATAIQAETSIAANTNVELPDSSTATKLNQPWFKVVIEVKQNSAAGTYHLDWISY